MKTQKRKIKEKNKSQEDKPPFFDVSCLKSRTVQVGASSKGKEEIKDSKPGGLNTAFPFNL